MSLRRKIENFAFKYSQSLYLFIFTQILKQVQVYENLIGPVVDSFKYLTSLSLDVMGYCVIETLSLDKDRTSDGKFLYGTFFLAKLFDTYFYS